MYSIPSLVSPAVGTVLPIEYGAVVLPTTDISPTRRSIEGGPAPDVSPTLAWRFLCFNQCVTGFRISVLSRCC